MRGVRGVRMPRINLRPYNVCRSCGYGWSPRGHNLSSTCPRCGSFETRVDYSGCIVTILVVLALFCAKPCSNLLDGFNGKDTSTTPVKAVNAAPWKPQLTDGKVTLKKACDPWGFDDGGTALIVRTGEKGDQFLYVEHDGKSTEVLETDAVRRKPPANRISATRFPGCNRCRYLQFRRFGAGGRIPWLVVVAWPRGRSPLARGAPRRGQGVGSTALGHLSGSSSRASSTV